MTILKHKQQIAAVNSVDQIAARLAETAQESSALCYELIRTRNLVEAELERETRRANKAEGELERVKKELAALQPPPATPDPEQLQNHGDRREA